jgi:putative transposase
MNDDVRQQIALERFKLISPILVEPTREQNAYFRTLAEAHHVMPYCRRPVKVPTLKGWLRRFRKQGFEGLKPTPRADRGQPRRLKGKPLDALIALCKAFPDLSVKKIHERLIEQNLIGEPPITYATISRAIKVGNLLPKEARCDVRKRFEAETVNDLWIADFMHGPKIKMGGKELTAILCAIIDDHSRLIVGWAFSPHETIGSLSIVLKQALLAHGLPKRLYVDNGSAFACDLLVEACARLSISLVHSKPYDSPSRGKIERFFRTVRERFLAGMAEGFTLNELNDAFAHWLLTDYHEKDHAGIGQRPIDRYHSSAAKADIKRFARAELDDVFLVRHERIVNNDATISFKNRIYEVPSAYIRQRIELRHAIDDEAELFLFDNGIRVATLKLVDTKQNCRVFTPSKAHTPVSYATGKVRK